MKKNRLSTAANFQVSMISVLKINILSLSLTPHSSHCIKPKFSRNWIFRMPMSFRVFSNAVWITNAPAVFQALVNDVLRDMLNRLFFVYLDDILLFSQNIQEHTQHVRLVL